MSNDLTIRNLDELSPINNASNNSKLLVRTSGTDNSLLYENMVVDIISTAKSIDNNFGWNATSLDGIPVSTEDNDNGHVLIYDQVEGAFVPKKLQPNDIVWDSLQSNKFLKVNINGNLVQSDVIVTDLKPTSVASANRFLQVNSDGTQVIESAFDFDSLLNVPTFPLTNADTFGSGIYVVSTGVGSLVDSGYILSSNSQSNDYGANQLYIGTGTTDDIRFRIRQEGQLYRDWVNIYHESNHPIRNDVDLLSDTSIASSTAVKSVNDKIEDLDARFNSNEILTLLKTVDGVGSGLDAELFAGNSYSDIENTFVNRSGDTLSGNLEAQSGSRFIATSGTASISIYSTGSRGNIDSNNPVAIVSGSSPQRIMTSGVLVSSSYNDIVSVPSNGVLSQGTVRTNTGFNVGSTNVVDSSGNMSWNRLKDIPSNVTGLGTASQADIGTGNNQISTNQMLLSLITPVGAVMGFAGNTPPSGWLVCDGSAVSRTTYANLFTYIGTLYGNGDGATTFNLPNMDDRFPRGSSASRPVGTMEEDQIRSHSHTATTSDAGLHTHSGTTNSAGTHSHTLLMAKARDAAPLSNSYGRVGYSSPTEFPQNTAVPVETSGAHTHTLSTNSTGNHTHSVTVNNTGGSETRPKGMVLLYCIKY